MQPLRRYILYMALALTGYCFLQFAVLLSTNNHHPSVTSVKNSVPFSQAQKWQSQSISGTSLKVSAMHIALIFDQTRLDYAMQAIRSSSYYSTLPIIYHLITPPSLEPIIKKLNKRNSSLYFYNYSICQILASPLLAFSNPGIHMSAHCKLYLAYILPSSVKRVLYIDNDITATQDISTCYFQPSESSLKGNGIEFSPSQFIAMGTDMGEICQQFPNLCWPMSFEWIVPQGVQCRTQNPNRKPVRQCKKPGQNESYQFNGGVMLMDLEKMKAFDFLEKFRDTVIRTARLTGFKKARWGEQDFINSFFRIYPETLKNLPCGCNYQYVGVKRHFKCPKGQPIYLVHGWGIGTKKRTENPYCKLFYYFKSGYLTGLSPPTVPLFSGGASSSVAAKTEVGFTFNYNCPHQSYQCSDKKVFDSGFTFHHDTIFILTRTAQRRSFFIDNRLSVLEQTHPFVQHLVLTDDIESTIYLKELGVNYTTVPSLYTSFNHTEPCNKCGGDLKRNCANAPGLDQPVERQKFLSCYCETAYPMNIYLNHLHEFITSQKLSGWIVYLDDDNLFVDRFALSEALAHATDTNQVLIWRSFLKRVTPSDRNWKRIVMGDIDTSGFMFHSNYINYTKWTNKRCGDYRTIASLSENLNQIWINKTYVVAHPLRGKLGGLGMRSDMKNKLTVIVTSYEVGGFRPLWLKNILSTSTSQRMSSLVHQVILVWNNPKEPPPKISGVITLKMKTNSLNNRWVETYGHIETDAVLIQDDDLLIEKDAVMCMMSYWLDDPNRLVGPFVRSTAGGRYSIDELLAGQNYSVILPRAMILHKKYLKLYSQMNPDIINYVNKQDAHCDDIALNMVVAKEYKKPPLRVLLPLQTIIDYYGVYSEMSRNETGGLGIQKDRHQLRTECVRWMIERHFKETLKFTNSVGTCGPRGVQYGFRNRVTSDDYFAMRKSAPTDIGTFKSW